MKEQVKIGDVIVPGTIVDITNKVAEANERKHRPVITDLLPGVSQMLAATKLDEEQWHRRFRKLFPADISPPPGKEEEYKQYVSSLPDIHDGAVLSDNVLLRDPKVLVDAAKDLHQQIRAGEMEAAGFVQVCKGRYPQIPWLVVRGISDFGDQFKNNKFHALASCAACSLHRDFHKASA